jgi:hypothetical protein
MLSREGEGYCLIRRLGPVALGLKLRCPRIAIERW